MKFGMSSENWALIEELLVKPLKSLGLRVWIFGSRARGNQREFSDVDILYEIPKGVKLPPGFLFLLKDKLEDSRLPYKVDLVDHTAVAQSYRSQVDSEKIEIGVGQ
jgi:predicted nucleotidyltransferase